MWIYVLALFSVSVAYPNNVPVQYRIPQNHIPTQAFPNNAPTQALPRRNYPNRPTVNYKKPVPIPKNNAPSYNNVNTYRHAAAAPNYAPRKVSKEFKTFFPNMSIDLQDGSFYMKFKDIGHHPLIIRRAPVSTIGEPWPMPQTHVVNYTSVFKISENIHIKIRNHSCDILTEAIKRFRENLKISLEEFYINLVHIQGTGMENLDEKYRQPIYSEAREIKHVHIHVNLPCKKYPSVGSDESYSILVKGFGITLMCNEVWGAIRGLETLSQLIFSWKNQMYIRETMIQDYPRFKHRGVLLDSARHFMSMNVIKDVLEGMYQNKMNVLHWHLSDDQSFPYASKVFPNLSKKGAFHPTLVYTQEDIKELLEYARLRGIRVIPEFDTPGHVYSWAMGHPELLTQCYGSRGKISGYYGPLNPARNSTFKFLKSLFNETFDLFPEEFSHLGGDEVPLECWKSNPEVNELLRRTQNLNQGFSPYNDPMKPVWEWYTNRLLGLLDDLKKEKKQKGHYILWEEASKFDLKIPKETVIQIWLGGSGETLKAINNGHKVLFSSCWYLDHSKYGVHWNEYYQCDPTHYSHDLRNKEEKILGGEVCLWSEYITSETAMNVLWPRASAAAERLWSNFNVRNVNDAGRRLQEHRCRMLRRGLQVGHINGPDYCLLPQNKNLYSSHSQNTYHGDINGGQYSMLIYRRITNIQPFILGMLMTSSGAILLFVIIYLKLKSKIFVICWTFR